MDKQAQQALLDALSVLSARIAALEGVAVPERGEQGPQGERGADGAQGDPGPSGPQGEQGPEGPQGPAGEAGPQGEQGKPGADGAGIANITWSNEAAAIALDDGRFFVRPWPEIKRGEPGPQGQLGPKGEKGERGDMGATGARGETGTAGVGIEDVEIRSGRLRVTLTDGREFVGNVKGPKGDPGARGLPQPPVVIPDPVVETVTESATMTQSGGFTLADASAGSITLTLPAAASGLRFTVKKVDATSNGVEIATPDAATIDGAEVFEIGAQYTSLTFTCDGTNWFIF
jgi:hypothetical protein